MLAAGCPELAPFMADECLLSLEGSEGIDYTMKEYMKLVAKTQQCVDRLNEQGSLTISHYLGIQNDGFVRGKVVMYLYLYLYLS